MPIYNEPCYEPLVDMADKSVDMILTDPPYDFDEKTKNAYHAEFTRVCKGAIVVFCPPENLWQPKCDQTLFWVKPISTKNTSKSYSRFVEVIQVWNGTTWNANRHWSQYTNVFMDLVENSTLHPYAKPESMLARLMLNHTNVRDTVLDPFMGIGTTGIVAVRNLRHFTGFEKDKIYYQLAQLRIDYERKRHNG